MIKKTGHKIIRKLAQIGLTGPIFGKLGLDLAHKGPKMWLLPLNPNKVSEPVVCGLGLNAIFKGTATH